jgi:hypothetical protein
MSGAAQSDDFCSFVAAPNTAYGGAPSGRQARIGADTMTQRRIVSLAAALGTLAASGVPAAPAHPAVLTHDPLVMRLDKDEFRIAFGIGARACLSRGCSGVIRYRVEWKTEDGALISDVKRVAYSMPPHAARTITVDRQYFDTAEGAHTTQVVKVTVERISCAPGGNPAAAQLAALTRHP